MAASSYSHCAAASTFCQVVGVQEIVTKYNEKRLEERLGNRGDFKKQKCSKKKRSQDQVVIIEGGGQASNSIVTTSATCFERDYPELNNLDFGINIGVTFVPPAFIPRKPLYLFEINEENVAAVQECIENESDLRNKMERINTLRWDFSGEQPEKLCFGALSAALEGEDGIVVIHSMELQNPDLCGQHIEIDFIVLDVKTKSIIVIEVKRNITLVNHKRGHKKKEESVAEKIQKQLQRLQTYISKWFGADISKEWVIVSFVFCLKINQMFLSTICNKCFSFVACGEEDFIFKLKNYRSQNQVDVSERTIADFKFLARYLIFGLSARRLVTTNSFLAKAKEIQELASSWESVKMWCFLTPGQLHVLSESKLIFLSGWGGGKTLTCIETAKLWAAQEYQVVFLVNAFCRLKTLLAHYLKLSFHDYQDNVRVRQINLDEDTVEELQDLVDGYQCVILDELPGDKDSLVCEEIKKKIQAICENKEKVWAAISNFDKKNTEDETATVDYVKDLFPTGFRIFTGLNKNMRNPKHIHADVQLHDSSLDESDRSIPSLTIQALNSKMESPPNLISGIDTDPQYFLKKAFTEKQLRVIIVARLPENAFLFHQVLQRLFHLDYLQLTQWDGKTCKDREADLKKWIQWRPEDPDGGPNVILTSKKLVNGFECEVIVSGEFPETRGGALGDIMSRTTCQRANFMDLLLFLSDPNNGLKAKPEFVESVETYFGYFASSFTWSPKRWFQRKPELQDIFKEMPDNYTLTIDKFVFIIAIIVATKPEYRATFLKSIPKLTWCMQLGITEKVTNETKTITLCSGFRHEESSEQIQWRAEATRRWYTPRKIVLPGSDGCEGSENIKFKYSLEVNSEFETCCKRCCSTAVKSKLYRFASIVVDRIVVTGRVFGRIRNLTGYQRM